MRIGELEPAPFLRLETPETVYELIKLPPQEPRKTIHRKYYLIK